MSRLLSALALVLVASATLSHAQDAAASASNTTANGSNSSARVGWVSPGSRRSTWDILWTCFSVFLICSWKCTHLNIPSAEESEAGWHKWHGIPYWPERLLRRKWRRKAWWMVVIALAPEVGVAAAVEQYINAREDRRTAEERAALRGGGGPFSMAHAFYANMGGFALAVPAKKSTVIKTGYGGVVKDGGENGKPTAKGDGVKPGQSQALEYRFLNLNSFAILQSKGFFPTITKEDIEDRSKADPFTKALAVFQSSALVIQCVARVASGLSITELELTTMAFVLCAFLAYIFWWHKPFDAQRSQVLLCQGATIREVDGVLRSEAEPLQSELHRHRTSARIEDLSYESIVSIIWLNWEHVGDTLHTDVLSAGIWPAVAFYAASMAVSAIHLAAWNWEFPSPLVQTLWRVFGLIGVTTSALPCLLLVGPRLVHFVKDLSSDHDGWLLPVLLFFLYIGTSVAAFCYIIARLSLLSLALCCFYSMPASVYEEIGWTAFIPHFS